MQIARTGSSTPGLRRQVVTWLVQIPLLFYAVHGSSSLFSPNGALAVGGSTVVDTDPGAGPVRLIVWSCSLVAVLLIYPLINSAFSIFNQNRYIAAIIVLATASALWSQEPTVTLQKDAYLIVTTCFGLYLIERFQPRQLMQVFLITGSIAIIGSLFLAVALPQYGIFTGRADASSGWQGIYSHKNTLGLMTVYFIAPALFLPVSGNREKLWRALYLAASLFLVGMSRSRGAWIMCAALIAFALVVTMGRRMSAGERLAAYWALGVVLIVCSVVVWAFLPILLRLLNKDVTLTGRTTIWSVLLALF